MQTIILVHGMGDHNEKTTKETFVKACQEAFGLYPELMDNKVKEYVNIVPIGYNDIFETHRQAMADRAKPVEERLNALGDLIDGSVADLVQTITDIDSSLDDDSFFLTHWLDVFFYRYTTFGENVRIKVAEKILELLDKGIQSQHMHIVGHSLGTAIVHDTLAKLYTGPFIPDKTRFLSTRSEKLGSVHMVANTSRVLESFVKVDESATKPGPRGCCSTYVEYRHKLDPITWVKPFDPTDNDDWISHDSFAMERYQIYRPSSITSQHGNTHSLHHYIFNPLMHLSLFNTAFDIELDENQISKGHDAYIAQTLSGMADQLESALGGLRSLDQNSVQAVVLAARKLKEFIDAAGGQWNA